MAVADDAKGAVTYEDYQKWEDEQDESKLRTMGRKQLIAYGCTRPAGSSAPTCPTTRTATGFSEDDLKALFEAIPQMYEHDRSASKGHMSVIAPLIIFRHSGTDSDHGSSARARQGWAARPRTSWFDLCAREEPDVSQSPQLYGLCRDGVPEEHARGRGCGLLTAPCAPIVGNRLPEVAHAERPVTGDDPLPLSCLSQARYCLRRAP
jgi:CRISPR-associated protein Csd2